MLCLSDEVCFEYAKNAIWTIWERLSAWDSKMERALFAGSLHCLSWTTDRQTETHKLWLLKGQEAYIFISFSRHIFTLSLRLRAADIQSPQVWAGGEVPGHQTCQWPPVLLGDAQWPRPLLKTVIIIILGPITGQGYCPLPSQTFSLSKVQLSVFCEEPVPRDNLVKNV